MQETSSPQVYDLVSTCDTMPNSRIKFLPLIVYKFRGKTILQLLVTKKEKETLQGLFRNQTLEVWMSNGESDIDQFDVDILKYKQVFQSLTKCGKMANQMRLNVSN